MISGQLIFREVGKETIEQTGKHLMMVVGIIAIPEGVVNGETQYVVTGPDTPDYFGSLMLAVHSSTGKPLAETEQSKPVGSLLLEPIWRV
jgi:hypothetical protein